MARTPQSRAAKPPVDIAADGAASHPITETPEFKAAVAGMRAELNAQILAMVSGLKEGKEPLATASPGTDQAFAQSLALAIATISDQGVGKGKRVSPEVMAQREAAHERMVKMIIEARTTASEAARHGDEGARAAATPSYRLRNKCYLDEQVVEPIWVDPVSKRQMHTEIDWPGVPNDQMIPINDIAVAIYAEWKQSVGQKPTGLEANAFGAAKVGLPPEKQSAVTAKGLVIKGGSRATREAINPDAHTDRNPGEGLRLRRPQQPGEILEIPVLGNLHPPARQMA